MKQNYVENKGATKYNLLIVVYDLPIVFFSIIDV